MYLRVVGVSDSQRLLVASDVSEGELDDSSLLEICHIKLDGSPLTSLTGFRNVLLIQFHYILLL